MRTLDGRLLLRNVDGDPDLLAHVVTLFLESSGEILDSMRTAIAESDAETLAKGAHQLRGALANVGAQIATEIATELEQAGRAGALAGAEAAYRKLEAEVERVGPALRELVAAARPPAGGDAGSAR